MKKRGGRRKNSPWGKRRDDAKKPAAESHKKYREKCYAGEKPLPKWMLT